MPTRICPCGFTCGTDAALERHLARFAEDDSHRRVLAEGAVGPSLVTIVEPANAVRDARLLVGSTVSSESHSRTRSDSADVPTPSAPPLLDVSPAGSWSTGGASPCSSPMSSPAFLKALASDEYPAEHYAFGTSSPANSRSRVRILFVRHAQSANKERAVGRKADADPDLTNRGYEQADALGAHLAKHFGPDSRHFAGVVVVSSPMRRCLLTILPAVRLLKLQRDVCFCHGGCYEFGCMGTRLQKDGHLSTSTEIVHEFSAFQATGFTEEGLWDYRGSSEKETPEEFKPRCEALAAWLRGEAAVALRTWRGGAAPGQGMPTLIFVTHRRMADLLCQFLVDGSSDKWEYGEARHGLFNAAMTEVFVNPDGTASFGAKNDDAHLAQGKFS